MGYDTINLRNNASFEVPLARNVSWVPFNRLGKSRFLNEELADMQKTYSPRQLRNESFYVYEAIQLYQMVRRFRECNDIVSYEIDGVKWQLHKSGRYAYETNEGCCASSAAWLNYIVGKTYNEKGYLHYLRPDGSGHVVNFIYSEGKYFVIDMSSQTYQNALNVPIETGEKQKYLSAELYLGICIMTNSLMDFVNYHRRIQLRKGYEFTYLVKKSTNSLPPCYSYNKNMETVYLEMGASQILRMQNFAYTSKKTISCDSIPIQYTNRYF